MGRAVIGELKKNLNFLEATNMTNQKTLGYITKINPTYNTVFKLS